MGKRIIESIEKADLKGYKRAARLRSFNWNRHFGPERNSLLHIAILSLSKYKSPTKRFNCFEIILDLIDRRRININIVNNKQETPLQTAAISNEPEVCQILLSEDKYQIDHQRIDGLTALHISALYGHLLVADILLNHYANMYIKDMIGNTAFDYALLFGNSICQLLATRVDRQGRSLLHLEMLDLLEYNPIRILGLIILNPGCINSQDHSGLTPLHIASLFKIITTSPFTQFPNPHCVASVKKMILTICGAQPDIIDQTGIFADGRNISTLFTTVTMPDLVASPAPLSSLAI